MKDGETTLGPIDIPVMVEGQRKDLVGHAVFFKYSNGSAELNIKLFKDRVPDLESFFELWDLLGLSFYAKPAIPRRAMTHSDNDKLTAGIPVQRNGDEVNMVPTNHVVEVAREDAGIYMSKAISLVRDHVKNGFDKSDPAVPEFEVFVVWFSKTLQNWKALVSTTLPDLRYYEVTYDGDKKTTYIDVYVKLNNIEIKDK